MRKHMMTMSRRKAVVAGGAIAASSLGLLSGAGSAIAQKAIQSGGGIAGGGSVALPSGGTASLSVFGSRFEVDGQADPALFGSLVWIDSDGTSIVSGEITGYGPVDDEENARLLAGFATVNGEGRHPFSLKLVDAGAASPSGDQLRLIVQPSEPAATPSTGDVVYDVEATLETGDLQLLTFEFEG